MITYNKIIKYMAVANNEKVLLVQENILKCD